MRVWSLKFVKVKAKRHCSGVTLHEHCPRHLLRITLSETEEHKRDTEDGPQGESLHTKAYLLQEAFQF